MILLENRYYTAPDEQGIFCVYDSQEDHPQAKVAEIKTAQSINANDMTQNITALLNMQAPLNRIGLEGTPRYFLIDGAEAKPGFKIRNGMGDDHTVCTFELMPAYKGLKDFLTPNFMSALCDYMVAPLMQGPINARRKVRPPS
jgi:hypothetical protein